MTTEKTVTLTFTDEEFRLMMSTMGRLSNMVQYDDTPAEAVYLKLLTAFHSEK